MPDEEVDQLLTQAELRLKAAQHLLMNEYYDDAVSRAYYSMYFAATALLLARNIQVKTDRGLVARFRARSLWKKDWWKSILAESSGSPWNSDQKHRMTWISREISEEEAAVTVDDAEGFLTKAKEVIAELRKSLADYDDCN